VARKALYIEATANEAPQLIAGLRPVLPNLATPV